MSTFLSKYKTWIVWISVWFLAVNLAWKNSSMAGGDNKDDVLNLALTIGYYNQLSLGCTVKAFDLASASVKAQVTKYRPTARLFKMKEEKEIQEWNTSNCPDRALPGIAYGAIKIANNNSYTRSEKE